MGVLAKTSNQRYTTQLRTSDYVTIVVSGVLMSFTVYISTQL